MSRRASGPRPAVAEGGRYTEYIQNTEKIRILTTIHAKYTKIRIEGKVSHLGGKTELFPMRLM